jgi:hypothetical protein
VFAASRPGTFFRSRAEKDRIAGVRMKALERNRLPGSWPLPNQPPPVRT